jgi:hypothetical protein
MFKLTPAILLLLTLILSACSDEAPPTNGLEVIVAPTTPSDSITESETTNQGPDAYPPLDESDQSGYPAPASPYSPPTGYPSAATPFPTITSSPEEFVAPAPPVPDEGLGAVVGQLLHMESDSAGSNLTIYLGVKVEAEPGPSYFISTQRNSSPQANTNAGGYFVINNVEPGLYALVLGSVIDSRVLANPETGQEYWVEVTAGETSDVGEVVFSFP